MLLYLSSKHSNVILNVSIKKYIYYNEIQTIFYIVISLGAQIFRPNYHYNHYITISNKFVWRMCRWGKILRDNNITISNTRFFYKEPNLNFRLKFLIFFANFSLKVPYRFLIFLGSKYCLVRRYLRIQLLN